ncbi:hypothetical protein ACF05L_12255 [Streptomyces bobili]
MATTHATVLAIDFTQGLDDAWPKVAQFVPTLVGFLVIRRPVPGRARPAP